MNLGISEKKALVLAGSKGLGLGCALALASEGVSVLLASRSEVNLNSARKYIMKVTKNEKIYIVSTNLEKKEELDKLFVAIMNKIGHPDIIISNFGGPPSGGLENIDFHQYTKWLNIGITNMLYTIKNFIPKMKENRWGRIIAITSSTVKQPNNSLMLSNICRSGLTAFLKTAANELAMYGITVNNLLPGMHLTERLESLLGNEGIKNKYKEIPAQKYGDPKDFGTIATFLAGKQSNFITGQSILVDGGFFKGI